MSNPLREKKIMHKTMHMPASKSKKNEKLIGHHPEEKKSGGPKKNPAKMFKNRADQQVYVFKKKIMPSKTFNFNLSRRRKCKASKYYTTRAVSQVCTLAETIEKYST